jgi:hypothetical protein
MSLLFTIRASRQGSSWVIKALFAMRKSVSTRGQAKFLKAVSSYAIVVIESAIIIGHREEKSSEIGKMLGKRLMFRKPQNESITVAYEWAQQITGEGQNWIEEYYWSRPMKILKAKLPYAKRCLLMLTGLQGTGKTIGLKTLATAMQEAGYSVVCFKWTKDWVERLKDENQDFNKIYEELHLDDAFRNALLKSGKTYRGADKPHIMEETVGKAKCRELKKEALIDFFLERRFIFIDMPDYSKSDIRFMSTDFEEIQTLWNSIMENEINADTTIILTMQKELSSGKHFFLGKFDITELPLLEPKELLETYRIRFKSLEPFTEETLELIAKLSRGVFRRFQKYCRLTIEEFMAAEKEPPITVEYAERAITESVIFNDMALELYDKFKNVGQRKLAVEVLSLLIKKRGEEMSQKQMAETLETNEMAVSRVAHVLAAEMYITRKRVEHGWLIKIAG